MKIALLVLLAGSALFFQNCGKSSQDVDGSDSKVDTSAIDSSITKTSVGSLENVERLRLPPQDMGHEMELETGRAVSFRGEPVTLELCLDHQMHRELKDLFANGEACEIQREVPGDQMCSFALVPPYLSVVMKSSGQVLNFGAASDGCRRETMDLCEHAADLQELISKIRWDEDFSDCYP